MTRRFNRRQRIALYLASGGVCEQCGVELPPGWHADHMQAWSHGGQTDVINGQALCVACNLKKGNKEPGMAKYPLREWHKEALQAYEAMNVKDFLLNAFPATGKTRFMSEIAKLLKDRGEVEAFIIGVPTVSLQKQTVRSFAENAGIQLRSDYNNGRIVRGQQVGIVETYDFIKANQGLLRAEVARYKTFVCLDEPHHLSEDNSWGDAALFAFEPAVRRLLVTGTPGRTDLGPLPYVKYNLDPKDGKMKAEIHYSLGYGRALREKCVRSVVFHPYGGEMSWLRDGKIYQATFDDHVNEVSESDRLGAALMWDGEHLGETIKDAHQKLMDKRRKVPDAAGIVFCMWIEHAVLIAARMRRELKLSEGDVIVVDSSDTKKAANLLEDFKKGKGLWVVCVRMISEGVDIPRLFVGIFATKTITELFIIQTLGRVLRRRLDDKDHVAHFYVPDDDRIVAVIREIERERDAVLAEEKEKEKREKGDKGEPSIYIPLSSTGIATGSIVGDTDVSLDYTAYATTLIQNSPQAQDFDPDVLAQLLKKEGIGIPALFGGTGHAQETPNTNESVIDDELEKLRAHNSRAVRGCCKKRGFSDSSDYAIVNNRLNNLVGISSVNDCADPQKLERRLKLVDEVVKAYAKEKETQG